MAKVESNEGNILQKGVQLNFNKMYSFTSRPYDQIKLNIKKNRCEQKIAYLLVLVVLVVLLFHRGLSPVDVRLMKKDR